MFKEDLEILKEETELLIADVKAAYESSGKRATGNFSKGLSAEYTDDSATIKGFVYLAGRGATKSNKKSNPSLREEIYAWLRAKGIRPREKGVSLKALAYLIARKIHRQGTDKDRHLKVYEDVITIDRIISIIDRFETINVNRIVTEITAELEILAENV